MKPLGPPSLGFDRETVRPVRQATHDLLKLLDDTEIFRDLRNHLVVYAEHNWIAGSLKVQHGIGEQIAGVRSQAADVAPFLMDLIEDSHE